MEKSFKVKCASIIGCLSGILCAFSTGMFLACDALLSIPSLMVGATALVFIVSVSLYLMWSR